MVNMNTNDRYSNTKSSNSKSAKGKETSVKSTKSRIVEAAWQLFYDQGYEETTVEDIIGASGTSRGSFYHYFDSKDALLGSLSYLFDEKYEELLPKLEEYPKALDKLLYLNRELFSMIENTIAIELLARLLSTQLMTRGEKQLLDRSRYYYRLLRGIFLEGQERGEFCQDLSVNEMVKLYAVAERALLYDWCICGGEYSLRSYGQSVMPFFLQRLTSDGSTIAR